MVEYTCAICKKKVNIEDIDGRPITTIIKDCNETLMCPSCYKEYGKPNFREIKQVLERIEKKIDSITKK